MINKKSLAKKRVQICSYDISKKEGATDNPRSYLVYPSLYQSDRFILLESEALWFYIYENIYDELVVHVDYKRAEVAFDLFRRFKRLILYKRYIEEKYKHRECRALLDFSDVDRVDKPGDSKYRYIKFIFSDKDRGEEEDRNGKRKKRFSSLIFNESSDIRMISLIVEEEGGEEGEKIFDIYKSKVYIDIYLEYYEYKHVEGG